MSKTKELLEEQFSALSSILKREQNEEGFWEGRLSSSALSTAIAIVALQIDGKRKDDPGIQSGFVWLSENINPDGGYGDTSSSASNVSTSLICYAAISYCALPGREKELLKSIEQYLLTKNISLTTKQITSTILAFYGKDYTFSVPILALLIICKVLPPEAIQHIPQLPFELSLLPPSLYRFFNLQVVSYAIPALIGVGIYIHTSRKSRIGIPKLVRNRFVGPAIRKLTTLMPESGGFLEAIPLTGFVGMCLIASGNGENEVVRQGIRFLENQQRVDGSWPIDTNLSTWVTTLSVKALGNRLTTVIPAPQTAMLKRHLLDIQYKETHPFNGAKPGGWGWTSFSGSVPDADDTPGAILALLEMYDGSQEMSQAVSKGCSWLVDLQNSDGGFPTFCKGWGKLPFDSSCADLTGHALLAFFGALDKMGDQLSDPLRSQILRSAHKAILYLHKHQSEDGHWLPLWFGNQHTDGCRNPVYGTARVSVYLTDCLNNKSLLNQWRELVITMNVSAQKYLLSQQNEDGSWGGMKGISGTTEETCLAISALAISHRTACEGGFAWLTRKDLHETLQPSPIGLYFAALWYDERMYPLVCYLEALRRFLD